MRKKLIGLLVLLAFVAAAESDQICEIDGTKVVIPDAFDCESYVNDRVESYRFPTFPWIRLPPILSTLFPNWPRWPTTPAPDDDDDDDDREECPDEGIKQISHPKSCEKYILCVGGTEIERRCAPGFHFSRSLRGCVKPEIAECEEHERVWECPEEDDLDNLVFIPNKKNCEKYYLCFGGDRIPMSCADGMHWSIDEETCMDEEEANCEFGDDIEECPDEGIKSISHPYDCEQFVLCVEGMRIKRDCPPGFHFSREFRNCVPADIAGCKDQKLTCPKEDDLDNLVFLPNLEDCSKYYLCFGGDPISLSCADGLHWSVEEETCLNKKIAGCEKFDDDIEQCPDEGIKSISHPDNCEKYILCVGGSRIKRNCAPGFHFSRDFRSCVSPDIAGCEDEDEDEIEECPDEGIKSISHPDNCEKYVLCVGGTRIKRNCAPGLHFSRKLRNCVDPDIAECEDQDEDDIEECPDEGVKSISHPDNCEKYVLCVGGTRIKRDCPPGFHFSRELRRCTSPDIAECEDKDKIEQCPDEGIKSISHPDNCEKYVLCVGGTRIKRNCAPGLHFSRSLRNCVQPEIAECEVQKLSCPKEDDWDNIVFLPNKEDCTMYYVCFGGDPIPLSCGNLHWSVDDQACMPPEEAGCEFGGGFEQCPDEGIKHISHPSSCEKYVLCIGGARIKRNCAPGFHFSRDFRSCVQPEIANCEDEDGEEDEETCPEKDDLTNLVFLPNRENCEKYYLCFGGGQIPFSCANGLHWNRKENMCMVKDEAGCKFFSYDVSCQSTTGLEYHRDQSDCQSYVVCQDGKPRKEFCNDGFLWDQKLQTCNVANLVEC